MANISHLNNYALMNDSSSDDDEIDEWKLYRIVQARKKIVKEPCRTSALTGEDYLVELIGGHSDRILDNCRITLDTFRRLCNVLREGHYIEEHHQRQVSIEESLAMFLTLTGTDGRIRVLAERFQHSTETIDRNVNCVVEALVRFAPNIIAPRNEQVIHPRIRNNPKFYPWFKVFFEYNIYLVVCML